MSTLVGISPLTWVGRTLTIEALVKVAEKDAQEMADLRGLPKQ